MVDIFGTKIEEVVMRIFNLFAIGVFCFLSLAQAQNSNDFRWSILSWNVDQIPVLGSYIESKRRSIKTIELLNNSSADIVVLQAVYRKKIQDRFIQGLSKRYPYQLALTQKTFKKKKFTPGFVVLSKYPLKTLAFQPYQYCADGDSAFSKGAFLFQVELDVDKSIQILTTHLQTGPRGYHQEIRQRQLSEMKQLLDKHKKSHIPQLVAGDLVIDTYHRSQYETLLKTLGVIDDTLQGDLRFSVGGRENSRTCKHGTYPKLSDYLLLANNQEAIVHIESKKLIRATYRGRKNKLLDLSAHYGLLTVLDWN